jgi:uncharacterized protein (DUF4213/DUF364 family)
VLLSDGSVGSSGNYSVQNHAYGYSPARIKQSYARLLASDPLLFQRLRDDHTLVGQSLFTAILSALSQDLLNESVLSQYGLKIVPATNWLTIVETLLRAGDTVKMIGYGGALPVFCASKNVRSLQICDLSFRDSTYRDLAWREIESFGLDSSRVTLSSDAAELERSHTSDIYFITGSALCNGTMERLLEQSLGCREVIVQGPSCSVFPLEFFRRSATLLLTTTKNRAEFDAGRYPGDDVYQYVDQNYIAISRTNPGA